MLKRLHLKNFTVFADADFEFVQGLNVLVGTNGTGKSHVLKVGYALEISRFNISREFVSGQLNTSLSNFIAWTAVLYKVFPAVFLSSHLEPLIRWDTKGQAEITSRFWADNELLSLNLRPSNSAADLKSSSSIGAVSAPSITREVFKPVLLPAKDILTLSWILPGSEQIVIPVESSYLDLLNQLRLLPLRNPETTEAIESLTDIVDGEIRAEGDNYFLFDKTGRRVAISMMAEGLRKFGTLQKLLANGSLTKNTTLYWDEPESNLNPALLRKLAAILAELARQGFQIILATHSMSLLKEFHILSREPNREKLPIRYFGLNAEPGQATTVVTKDDFKFLPDVVALEVELDQADELEDIFAREARQRHADTH